MDIPEKEEQPCLGCMLFWAAVGFLLLVGVVIGVYELMALLYGLFRGY